MEDLSSLLLLAASGDTVAYHRIVSHFRDMAYSYAYPIIRDFHLAEDVTQEAFLPRDQSPEPAPRRVVGMRL